MRRVLVVAYYFPPMGLSGVQRTAKFVRYLPEFGWAPTVLTVEPGGYFAFDPSLLAEVEAAGVPIHRTASLDPTQLFGRRATVSLPREPARRRLATLSQWLFVPDNKLGWLPFAWSRGRALGREHGFDAVFSSAPPYTAHLVAALLSRRFGRPLVTDFRDDWVGNPRHVYPTPWHRAAHRRLERWVMQTSRRVLAINPHIRDALARRNRGAIRDEDVLVLPQGYDPADFAAAPSSAPAQRDVLHFVHSGVFYDVQTPDFFLRAWARLLAERPVLRDRIRLTFVGLVPEASRRLAERLGLEAVIRWEGYRPHAEVIAHLQAADVLWMTIGRRPGAEGISTSKLYEYVGARKPILALVPEGEAARTVRAYGAGWIAPPDDEGAIAAVLAEVVAAWEAGRLPEPVEDAVVRYDRRRLAGGLAQVLEACVEDE